MMKFIEERPASRFGEAYPVGDGWMGAVVYGSFPVERITVTEHTFFSGKQSDDNYQPEAPQVFQKMRELLEKGKYQEAHEEAEKFQGIWKFVWKTNAIGNCHGKKLVLMSEALILSRGLHQYLPELRDVLFVWNRLHHILIMCWYGIWKVKKC